MISVLMSTYNENEEDLRASIESVLAQTYKEFEFIIVNDNPHNPLLRETIEKYKKNDSRIIYVENEENIGLALSLNRAASIAKGEYLLRMDADDISYPDRFEKELNTINSGEFDLVCSGYDIIDEDSMIIAKNCGLYPDQSLRTILPYEIAVHHPTVIMRKDCFLRIGGYRNFKCAQDYDLWLRMWTADCKMFQLPQALLKYRIRTMSTTSQKKYLQKCTMDYITRLFHERLQKMNDSYSYNDYLRFVDKCGANNPKAINSFLKQHKLLSAANKELARGNKMRGLIMRGMVFLWSRSYRKSYLNKFKTAGLIRRYHL